MPDVSVTREGARVRIVFDAPKGNAITDAMVVELRHQARSIPSGVKLVTLETAGHDFSFGSSLDEHVPDRMRDVLPRFLALIADWLRVPAATAAVVSGRCLGGGFELALACDFLFASDDALLGLPEITVGAFPPIGALLLPLKIGGSRATSAVLGGEPQPALAWREAGLIERVARRASLPMTVADWYESTIARYSAATLARAVRASRLLVLRSLEAAIPEIERLYVDELLTTADAAEGIAAFLEKRSPEWKDR